MDMDARARARAMPGTQEEVAEKIDGGLRSALAGT
jgi:hypothetical protein